MKWRKKCAVCAGPSLIGMVLLFFLPFLKVLYYSVLNNQFDKKFVGLQNYYHVLRNPYFQLALKNSLLIILFCVPVLILSALLISILIQSRFKLIYFISSLFILPMTIPTAAIIPIWHTLFQSSDSVIPIYALFIWKNIGICIIFLSAAINAIPTALYEAASLEGAVGLKKHLYITIPCIFPAVLFTVLLSIVNSFRIYKESYLYFGTNYPPEHSYTLQYYMNNNFLKLDYQALSAGAILNTMIILLIVLSLLKIQRKYAW